MADSTATEIIQHNILPIEVLVISILVLYLGMFINRHVKFLRDYYIPPAVVGGLICSVFVALIYSFFDLQINFDMRIRDVLLLVFFSTIGLSANFKTLLTGGKPLAILVVIAAVFLVVQDTTAILIAVLMDAHPGYGLMGGSISLAGGHGTAIAWGKEADAAGLVGASELGLAFATFGLIAGGIFGGPIAKLLVERYKVHPDQGSLLNTQSITQHKADENVTLFDILNGILVLAICVGLGHSVNEYLFAKGVLLPGFLTAMVVGIVIANVADLFTLKINRVTIDTFGEVSLAIFLSMSLMSMQLWTLAQAFGPIMIVMSIQVLVITVFAATVVFCAMGRDYDASVMTAGFVGLGLGATPVAIANMKSVTDRYGPSIKAFLIMPLVGAFFIDLLNAATIKFFINVIENWLI